MPPADLQMTQKSLRRLSEAFAQNRLSLFLGAGVSIDSGLPSWRNFLGTLFLNSPRHRYPDLSRDILDAGVAEWFFKHNNIPLEIVARKIRASYKRDDERYLQDLRIALYNRSYLNWVNARRPTSKERRAILRTNNTMKAILTLCRRTAHGRRGLRRVVTYNYDNLLELLLPQRFTQPVWRPIKHAPKALPIYHVHGYVPVNPPAHLSPLDNIVLTEDEYNRVANDPYSWTNLVQLQALTDSVGLVVGMSLDDRNLRRLLDATSRVARPEIYAFMEKPQAPELADDDIPKIQRFAQGMLERWRQGRPDEEGANLQILATDGHVRRMLARHHQLDIKRLSAVLDDLGIRPLWYNDVGEVAAFIKQISI